MKQEELTQMFNNRWRIKSDGLEDTEVRRLTGKQIKKLCRDFFEAGICLGENSLPSMDAVNNALELQNKLLEEIGADVRVDATTAFEEWWKLFDKKRGKEKCLKKWLKMTACERYACFASTPAYVASTPDKQFRKDPLTYLNGKCWNDEIIPYNGTDNKPSKQQQDLSKLASILTD